MQTSPSRRGPVRLFGQHRSGSLLRFEQREAPRQEHLATARFSLSRREVADAPRPAVEISAAARADRGPDELLRKGREACAVHLGAMHARGSCRAKRLLANATQEAFIFRGGAICRRKLRNRSQHVARQGRVFEDRALPKGT